MSKIIISFLGLILVLIPMIAFAAVPQPEICSNGIISTNPGAWITCIINNVIKIVVWPVFITAVVIMFIWAGFKFLTAQGEPGKIAEARKALIWAVVGVAVGIIAFSAYATIKFILGIQ